MPPVGFEPTISAGERPKTYALDRTATGTGTALLLSYLKSVLIYNFLILCTCRPSSARKDVRILGCFSKPKGFREQKRLENTDTEFQPSFI